MKDKDFEIKSQEHIEISEFIYVCGICGIEYKNQDSCTPCCNAIAFLKEEK